MDEKYLSPIWLSQLLPALLRRLSHVVLVYDSGWYYEFSTHYHSSLLSFILIPGKWLDRRRDRKASSAPSLGGDWGTNFFRNHFWFVWILCKTFLSFALGWSGLTSFFKYIQFFPTHFFVWCLMFLVFFPSRCWVVAWCTIKLNLVAFSKIFDEVFVPLFPWLDMWGLRIASIYKKTL